MHTFDHNSVELFEFLSENKVVGHVRINLKPWDLRDLAVKIDSPISFKKDSCYIYWKNFTFISPYDEMMNTLQSWDDADYEAEVAVDDSLLEKASELESDEI